MRRVSAVLLIVAVLAVSIFILAGVDSFTYRYDKDKSLPQNIHQSIDQLAKERLGSIKSLETIAKKLSFLSGNIRKNGIYVTETYLMRDIQNTDPQITSDNIDYLIEQLERFEQPTYLMLIPTVSAIKQQELPSSITDLFNQRNFIAEIYNRCINIAATVDAYSNLFAAKEQYTYYRNSSNLTALGGYYLYQALSARLGITPRPPDQFEVEHLAAKYYGDLAREAEYYDLPPDIITLYKYTGTRRNYMLTHYNGDEMRRYYNLFPKHLEEIGRPTDVVLGGESQRLDITASAPYQESCLIIGDKTALSYLPFLAVHYGNITFLDIYSLDETLVDLDYDLYDQVIIGLSVEALLEVPISSPAK